MVWFVIGCVLALALGIYIGLGHPGLPGPEDRVLPSGSKRHRLNKVEFLDWLRPRRRDRRR